MTSGALALTRFDVTPTGDREGRYVSIACRRRGLRALIRTALGLDLNVCLDVKHDAVEFKDLSLFEETYRTRRAGPPGADDDGGRGKRLSRRSDRPDGFRPASQGVRLASQSSYTTKE